MQACPRDHVEIRGKCVETSPSGENVNPELGIRKDVRVQEIARKIMMGKTAGRLVRIAAQLRNPARAELEKAVKAWRLYLGSSGNIPVPSAQRLYDRAMGHVRKIAKKTGMVENDVYDQLVREAEKLGKIVPKPGKDY
jgi:hypothetical protein